MYFGVFSSRGYLFESKVHLKQTKINNCNFLETDSKKIVFSVRVYKS